MIIYMSDIICVTNRKLCKENFLERIEKIAKENPKGIILREKDLPEQNAIPKNSVLVKEETTAETYEALAKEVLAICDQYHTPCILHSFVEVAKELNCRAIHLPFPILQTLSEKDRRNFTILGASCHSVVEAKEAQRLGCTYIIAGHIFETDCKKGSKGRGLHFLQEVCESVAIPVYAIGGIHAQNINEVRNAGATGACMMSAFMTCEEPGRLLAQLEE